MVTKRLEDTILQAMSISQPTKRTDSPKVDTYDFPKDF